MSGTLCVLWTLSTTSLTAAPRPILRCRRCDAQRPFGSSGKFRLNANGKRLDAWLVYRCATCGDTWNRPVFERRVRAEMPPHVLDALQGNDPALADAVARDATGLSRWATRLEEQADAPLAIERRLLGGDPATTAALRITVACQGHAPRGDRLLAVGIGISRARVSALAEAGRVARPAGRRALSRPLVGGALLSIDLTGLEDARRLAEKAAGLAQAEPG